MIKRAICIPMKNMFPCVISLLVSIFYGHPVFAAECESENYDMNSQAEVDALGETGCDVVLGDLTIQGSTVESLLPLSNLELVNGKLRILNNGALSSLNGLDNLRSVGDRVYLNGRSLSSIDALNSLTSVGGVFQMRNTGVAEVDGLQSLVSVGGSLIFEDNSLLEHLDGLINVSQLGGGVELWFNQNLRSVEGLINLPMEISGSVRIYYAPSLEQLDGFANTRSINGFLEIIETGVSNIDGFSNLVEINGSLSIKDNTNLAHIDGLSSLRLATDLALIANHNLANVNGLSSIESVVGQLYILGKSLENLNGLSGLKSVGGQLVLGSGYGGFIDPSELPLSDVDGLAALTYVGGDMSIDGYPNLTNCRRLAAVLGWPSGPPEDKVGGDIRLFDNGPGCSSVDEVLESISTFDNLLFFVQRTRGG